MSDIGTFFSSICTPAAISSASSSITKALSSNSDGSGPRAGDVSPSFGFALRGRVDGDDVREEDCFVAELDLETGAEAPAAPF